MAKYRICKHTFWSTSCKQFISHYYVDKKIFGLFWWYIKGGFETDQDAENWIKISNGKESFNEVIRSL